MANYIKSTNFTSKDSLPTGNALKIVKGAEFDVEFNAIATAITSKADLQSPEFTGTPTTPTPGGSATSGQIANVGYVSAVINAAKAALYPVGSIYINATDSTNPGTLLGFGTWTAFGAGRVPVGFNASDPLFDTAEETGGSKDAVVVSHTHTATDAGHTHSYTDKFLSATSGNYGNLNDEGTLTTETRSSATGFANITVASTGVSGTNANLQPYITVYMWKRTA